MIAGLVVVFLTILLAIIARWHRIMKVMHSRSTKVELDSPELTHLMLYPLLPVLPVGLLPSLHQV